MSDDKKKKEAGMLPPQLGNRPLIPGMPGLRGQVQAPGMGAGYGVATTAGHPILPGFARPSTGFGQSKSPQKPPRHHSMGTKR